MTATFTFKQMHFTVRKTGASTYEYRETRHIGGPWSSVGKTLESTSVHSTFKRLLREACQDLHELAIESRA